MKKEVLQNIGLLLVTILVIFAFCEITVRILGLAADSYGFPEGMYLPDEDLGYKFAPDFSGTFVKSEFSVDVSTNSFGTRNPNFSIEKNEFRVLALGDSFTWGGYGTTMEESFPYLLQQKIPNSLVINTGVPGYGTDQQLEYLKKYGLDFQPDVVLVNFFVGNDFADNAVTGELTAREGYLVRAQKTTFLDSIRGFLLSNLHTYRLFENAVLNNKLLSKLISSDLRNSIQGDAAQIFLFENRKSVQLNSAVNNTLSILAEIKDIASKKNMTLIVVAIPLKYQVDIDLRQQFLENNGLNADEIDFEQPQNILAEFSRENNILYLDLLPVMARSSKDNDFFWEFNPHFNKAGNVVAASAIYDFMKSKDLINRSVTD